MPKSYQLNIIQKINKDSKKGSRMIFLKKKKKKRDNMVVKVTKIFQKMKKTNWLSIEKYIIE